MNNELVKSLIEKISGSPSAEYKLGALSVMYAAAEDDATRQEIVQTLVYIQTLEFNTAAVKVSNGTRAIANTFGITDTELQKAGEVVREAMATQQQEDNNNA